MSKRVSRASPRVAAAGILLALLTALPAALPAWTIRTVSTGGGAANLAVDPPYLASYFIDESFQVKLKPLTLLGLARADAWPGGGWQALGGLGASVPFDAYRYATLSWSLVWNDVARALTHRLELELAHEDARLTLSLKERLTLGSGAASSLTVGSVKYFFIPPIAAFISGSFGADGDRLSSGGWTYGEAHLRPLVFRLGCGAALDGLATATAEKLDADILGRVGWENDRYLLALDAQWYFAGPSKGRLEASLTADLKF